jgi:hypothetical protein
MPYSEMHRLKEPLGVLLLAPVFQLLVYPQLVRLVLRLWRLPNLDLARYRPVQLEI